MNRDEAETLFTETIMERGNPRYFIYQALSRMDDEDLIYQMQELNLAVEEIEEEE